MMYMGMLSICSTALIQIVMVQRTCIALSAIFSMKLFYILRTHYVAMSAINKITISIVDMSQTMCSNEQDRLHVVFKIP